MVFQNRTELEKSILHIPSLNLGAKPLVLLQFTQSINLHCLYLDFSL